MLFWVLFPWAVMAQGNAPVWLDDNVRNAQFPQDKYYSGFTEVSVNNNDTQENALNRAKQRAIGELSERIRTIVSSLKTQTDVSISGSDIEEQIRSRFSSVTQTESQTNVTNSKVESWYDSQTRTAYAFAYVSRAELTNYYRKQIDVDLNKVETAINLAKQLMAVGKKMSAERKIEIAIPIFNNISFNRDLLVAMDTDKRDLQTQRGNELQQTIEQLRIQIEQSTFVYMNCSYESKGRKDDAFSSDPGIFCNIIAQALSENDCSITDNKEEADYELTLVTSTAQRSSGQGGQFAILSYYANVKGTLYNRLTQKQTTTFIILNDPDAYAVGRNPEDAATKAFKLPALKNKVMENILPKIKN